MPVLHAILGLAVAYAVGLSMGGAIILATLAASASYIAAPAAVQLALPEANPSFYLTCSLAITFPFNITLGLPLYQAMAAHSTASCDRQFVGKTVINLTVACRGGSSRRELGAS